jgi:hypothetical protein
MMRSGSDQAPSVDERQTSGATDFDAALDAYLAGGDCEALLRAAAIVIECELPLTHEHADAISNLTGESIEIESYSDAGHAVRRWFATMDEDAARY